MSGSDSTQMVNYELPLEAAKAAEAAAQLEVFSLPESILANNVVWFCRLRWLVVAMLLAFGAIGQFEWLFQRVELHGPGLWPFVAGGVLALCNVAYMAHARWARSSGKSGGSSVNLQLQIVLDLLVLTAVVHFLGSVRTYVPFTYLFHIVLSCVFFSRRRSLAVVLLASMMFGACITAENFGVIEKVTPFADGQLAPDSKAMSVADASSFPTALVIWTTVWYLASHLSQMVQMRDVELDQTNRRLVAAREERSRHMLTMTHQLKAPFAAIHANVQLLLKGHCGELPAPAIEVAERIAARSRRLAAEIKEMLQLANLSSSGQKAPEAVELDLSEVLNWCVEQVRPLAEEREVTLDKDIHPARTRGIEDHLKMLFGNLLANAVLYSHTGGRVAVQCRPAESAAVVVTIADEGIGIAAEKLPRIFDEHYRTKEAVRHNKESSGLGLSIVRHVVELHGIRMQVRSQFGAGTTFELWFPGATESP